MTWINQDAKFVYVHIPRTGGRSIQRALRTAGFKNDLVNPWVQDLFGQKSYFLDRLVRKWNIQLVSKSPTIARLRGLERVLSGHLTLTEISACIELAEDTNVFWVTRNPFDWLVSVYSFAHQNKSHSYYKARGFGELSFEQFVMSRVSAEPTNTYIGPRSVRNKYSSTALKFEDLGSAAANLSACIGIELPPVEQSNSSSRRAYRNYYDVSLRNHVEQICRLELEEHNYEF